MGILHTDSSADLAPGAVFADHRIDAIAGWGGMGVVYRATQLALDRTVALKVIAPGLTEDGSTRERFLRESKLAASIDHPNVIPIFYAGDEDGIAYIAMRYVAGDDLRTLVRREGGLAPERAVRIVEQIGAALDAAHAAGMVHRDVKPANVLLGPGEHVYLTDFGLTKQLCCDDDETQSGHWVGTLDYVSPEQIRAQRVDARTDVYALGSVLYYALTGRVPYDRPSDEARLWAHLSEPPPRPSDLVAGLPRGLDDVVARALAKAPDDRYPSGGDLGRAARCALTGDPIPQPERTVAVGSAAPEERPTLDAPSPWPPVEAAVGLPAPAAAGASPWPPMAPAGIAPPPVTTGPVARASRARRARLAAAAGIGALALAAAAIAGLPDDGDAGSPVAVSSATGQPPVPAAAEPVEPGKVVRTVRAGRRPTGVAVAGAVAWVMSHDLERIARVDVATGSRRRGPVVGRGASDIAAQGRSLYVTNLVSRTVQRRHASTGRLLARTPPLAGSPVRVVPGERSLWVAERTTMPGGADSLVELDPRTLDQRRRIPLAQGVRALRTGGGAVWILSRRAREVARLDPPTGRIDKVVRLHEEGEDLAYAHGRLWIANRDDDTVTRMDAATGRSVTLAVPREPARIAARGNDVWVTSYLEGTLTRIDARRDRIIGTPVAVGVQPYGVAVTPDSVWVTSPGEDRLRQVATD